MSSRSLIGLESSTRLVLEAFSSCSMSRNQIPVWPRLEPLLIVWGRSSGIPYTEFTAREKRQADFLEMGTTWNWDYPKPEKDFGYIGVTYDVTDYCSKCGVGAKQIAPFGAGRNSPFGRKVYYTRGKNGFASVDWAGGGGKVVVDKLCEQPLNLGRVVLVTVHFGSSEVIWGQIFSPFPSICTSSQSRRGCL